MRRPQYCLAYLTGGLMLRVLQYLNEPLLTKWTLAAHALCNPLGHYQQRRPRLECLNGSVVR